MKIIINADDFGISKEVNKSIYNAAKNGFITSSTIISVSNYVDEAIKMTKILNFISFGVHLTLTDDFYSLSTNKKLNKSNWGYNGLNLFKLFPIIKEFCLQIEKLKNRGVKISHIDTHHHIHRYPLVLIAVIIVAKKYKINKIRTQILCHKDKKLNAIYRKTHQKILKFFKINTIDCYTDFHHFNKLINTNNKTIEIMCHPGSEYNDEIYFNSNFYNKINKFLINYKEIQ